MIRPEAPSLWGLHWSSTIRPPTVLYAVVPVSLSGAVSGQAAAHIVLMAAAAGLVRRWRICAGL